MAKRILADEFFYILSFSLFLLALIFLVGRVFPVWLRIIRLVMGLGYVLFIPGYCLQALAFPSRSEVDGKERLALSFGLSLAVIPTLALILNNLPWKITLWSVSLGLFIIILLSSIFGLIRRNRLPEAQRYMPIKEINLAAGWRSLERSFRIAYILLAVVLLIAGSTAISIVTSTKPAQHMTEFYQLALGGQAENYPRQGVAGQPLSVMVGIRNLEGAAAAYRVEARDEKGIIGQAGSFFLNDGEQIESPLAFTPQQIGENVPVTISLYRDDRPEPYRTLKLWLKVNPAP